MKDLDVYRNRVWGYVRTEYDETFNSFNEVTLNKEDLRENFAVFSNIENSIHMSINFHSTIPNAARHVVIVMRSVLEGCGK